ncbi:dihydrolipoyllysine-residue succinyltransferase component of 2-oxoglutarate dehydrogenase complex [Sulfuriferula plumbiphila]|uniref:Dihydrolipoyllysine-residue succinyltransferase n=1 Tax=Sulfuriferula plumbiphila TaxID=171865 RepID=A0A512L4J6_9PROT|nr:dihydrolipoyllysine-residue succinyltransferase [Sulfuriferula plumbiphila]BBP03797.1 dihydrolipoyllysine-residue succinyltransferase component of 2-oxoglutarate dehydrogenase complex [Sulfuriferula plumbiphila]GEP29374.1 dihydrolipoyllysine-residue succinyltransferase component of 2-oxoglutarate dehydrogenase complex [Sulfuriferula plumbiphila]
MLIEVKTPELSDSITEGTLLEWHKQPGDTVVRDETLIDLETDKVILEISAPASGVLVELLRENGAVVTAGEVIARIENGEPETAAPPLSSTAMSTPLSQRERERAGEGGRSMEQDKPASAAQPAASKVLAVPSKPAPSVIDTRQGRSERREPMSRLRARVAERLVAAQHSAAILTTFNEVNMQPVMDLRARYKDDFQREHGVKLGFMSFFVKAALLALRQFPVVNAAIDGSDIVHHDYYDIGIAVSTTRGLVVPILRDADCKGFADIERAIGDFARRAEALQLTLEELSGGTFSISNGGVFGSLLSTPILNPPQSAILGMHKIQERPIAENGQVVIRPMMYLALSYDHRLIDGRDAVQFLVEMKTALEDPARLMLGI